MKKLISLLSFCALMWSAVLQATPPERISFGPWNYKGMFVTECSGGFDILWDFTYYGEYVVYYDKDGSPERIFYNQSYPGSYYNSLFPDVRVFQNKSNGDQRWIEIEDGQHVVNDIRVHTVLTVPGYGIIQQDVGRVVLDLLTYEVIFEARDYSFDLETLCEVLTP